MPQFRAKARAIDLLGKGQISDLPTAISELWKNGYDAYGDNLEAYLYMDSCADVHRPFFVISDDGKGMSRQDILEKWIVLGTDSKTRCKLDTKGEETLWKNPRVKMGEKGIGRLSVAYLGSPMLMLTKKIGSPLQALFIDWRILENYGLYIENINIPLLSIKESDDFGSVFNDLKKEFLDNFKKDKSKSIYLDRHILESNLADEWHEQHTLAVQIIESVEGSKLPSFFTEEMISPLCSVSTNTHGTKFVIFEPDEQLIVLSQSYQKDINNEYEESINEIRSSLNGLFNVFKEENIAVATKFIVVTNDGERDLISSREFFSYHDFANCDHLIDGRFDETGQFSGAIRVYKKDDINHIFRNPRRPGNTAYGAFNLKVGVIVGVQNESMLNEEQFRAHDEKLKHFGGLYIYRDGFRVLPYGRTETDFLRFENRRSKHAGSYFFSHRRMLGYIEISRVGNKKLVDKAGREGFINNLAYKEFKTDLEAFFIDLAKKYFGTDAEFDYKENQKSDIEKASKSAKEEHEKEKALRKEYGKKLKEYPQLLDVIIGNYQKLLYELKDKQQESVLLYEDIDFILKQIEDCKLKIRKLSLDKPVRFSLTENQRKNLHAYQDQYRLFVEQGIPDSQDIVNSARTKMEDFELFKELEAKYNQYRTHISNVFDEATSSLNLSLNRLKEKISNEKSTIFLKEIDEKYDSIKPNNINRAEILLGLTLLDNIYKDLIDKAHKRVSPFLQHIDRISLDIDEEALTGYYKIRYEEIEKRWTQTKELAQMGIAIEIIDHQFNALYSQVAYAISQIKDYLPDDEKTLRHYQSLKSAFEHLEDKYKLMSPLYRTTGKVRKNIGGEFVKEYLNSFFNRQFEELGIRLQSTLDFDKATFTTFESILLPAFVNIIHNAVYWLKSSNNKQIILDFVNGSKILIVNSGEPIEDFYLEDIFKLFYSQKPNGRGIGLYIAKETLMGIGYDLFAASNKSAYNRLQGACFVIDTTPENSFKNE